MLVREPDDSDTMSQSACTYLSGKKCGCLTANREPELVKKTITRFGVPVVESVKNREVIEKWSWGKTRLPTGAIEDKMNE